MNKEITFWKPLCKQLYLSKNPYFMKKDRNSGEKDLELLVDSEKQEGSWLFTPHDKTWYNLGGETIVDEDGIGIYFDMPSIEEIGGLATHYHTHPKFFADETCEKKIAKVGVEGAEELCLKLTAIDIAIPSPQDIAAYTDILRSNFGCNIDFRIASPYGIIQIEFSRIPENDEAIERYAEICNKEQMIYVALLIKNTPSAISFMINKINYGMQGVFTASMTYRK